MRQSAMVGPAGIEPATSPESRQEGTLPLSYGPHEIAPRTYPVLTASGTAGDGSSTRSSSMGRRVNGFPSSLPVLGAVLTVIRAAIPGGRAKGYTVTIIVGGGPLFFPFQPCRVIPQALWLLPPFALSTTTSNQKWVPDISDRSYRLGHR